MTENLFDLYDFSSLNLEGVPIFYKKILSSPSIHIRLGIKTGSFSDPYEKEGLSHFLEHLIFNGSPNIKNKKELSKWSKKYTLDTANISTSYTGTIFRAKTLPHNFEKVIGDSLDLIFEPFIRDEDVEHERKVIAQEAWRIYKNEKLLSFKKYLTENIFNSHIHQRMISPLGWPNTISKITRKDLVDFHQKYYKKENLFIVLAGNINDSDLDILKKYLANIPSALIPEIDYGSINKPMSTRIVRKSIEIGITQEQTEFSIERILDFVTNSNSEIFSILVIMLRDLLNERLRMEKGLSYSVSVSGRYNSSYSNISIFSKIKKEDLEIFEKEIWGIINGIIRGSYKKEFEEVKESTIEKIKFMELLPNDLVNNMSNHIINNIKTKKVNEEISLIEKMTYEDIKKMTERIFDKEWVTTVVVLPE